MPYQTTVGHLTYRFADLKTLLAKASPARSGDYLAGLAAATYEERMAAKIALADVPLSTFLIEALIPYETDEVTRLIIDRHDQAAFAPISHLTVGDLRDWLLLDSTDSLTLAAVAPGITPEMAAAVSKLMRNQDLILVAKKCRVISRFRNTLGLPGHLSVRLQPNHPTDDPSRDLHEPVPDRHGRRPEPLELRPQPRDRAELRDRPVRLADVLPPDGDETPDLLVRQARPRLPSARRAPELQRLRSGDQEPLPLREREPGVLLERERVATLPEHDPRHARHLVRRLPDQPERRRQRRLPILELRDPLQQPPGERLADPEVGPHERLLDLPGEVVPEALREEEVARLREEDHRAAVAAPALGFWFGVKLRTKPGPLLIGNLEVVHALLEVLPVLPESVARRVRPPTMGLVDLAERHDPDAPVFDR